MGQGTRGEPAGKLRGASRHLLREAPTERELAFFGLTLEQATRAFLYWPDNAEALRMFSQLFTQWRTGVNGPIGLDYTAVVSLMGLHAIPESHRLDLFADLRVLEDEALKVIRAKAKTNA